MAQEHSASLQLLAHFAEKSVSKTAKEREVKKLYIGNFSFRMTDAELRSLFEPYGVVQSANIVTNPETGKSRGFAFVAMANDDEADRAMAGLNGKEADGRALTVNEARKSNPSHQ